MRPLSRLALNHDVAAVLAQDLATDRQAQARALRSLGADERLEYVRDFSGGMPVPLSTTRMRTQPSSGSCVVATPTLRFVPALHGVQGVADDVQQAPGAALPDRPG